MRDSFFILGFFLIGIGLGRLDAFPAFLAAQDAALWTLWVFMFMVGLSIGGDQKFAEILSGLRISTFALPFAATAGTFAGAAACSLFVAWSAADCLAVGAGFGYYSLSSVFIGQYKGAELGTVALACNIFRELFTLLLAPLIARFLGPAALVVSGGSTTIDTTLPVITRYAGREWILPAIAQGMLLDLSVPFWVTLFCSL